jgi:3-phenylpropionate/trans-cinnamate dioxygenase ferredoxin reductase subunit
MKRRVVIVGGGVAGAAAASELRERGFDGELVLVTDDAEPPYERPPLSKEYLLDAAAEHPAVNPEDFYEREAIELLPSTTVTALDLHGTEAVLDDGRRLGYNALVLATGVRPRPLPGILGERVHYLRTAEDARALRAALAGAGRVAIVGGGLLGCEIAAVAAQLGREVSLISAAPRPLLRCVGSTVAAAVSAIHRDNGVEIRGGEQPLRTVQHGERIELTTTAGVTEFDLVVVACGSLPNVGLAKAAGLALDDGVLVDERCRTTAPNVYAAGDVARRQHPRYARTVRVEHHDTAIRLGQAAARDILGSGEPFAEPHWFWSDQYDHSLQAVGEIDDPDEAIVRGSVADGTFSMVGLRDGRLRFVIALDRPRDVMDARRIMSTEHQLTPEQVADASVPLKRMVLPDRRAAATQRP